MDDIYTREVHEGILFSEKYFFNTLQYTRDIFDILNDEYQSGENNCDKTKDCKASGHWCSKDSDYKCK